MRYCLIGEKLSHSKSKEIHGYFGYDYTLAELKREELKKFIRSVKEGAYGGFNVTIPYKKEIIPYLDEVDKFAEKIGAVNTVAVKGGKLVGYNTDFFGMKCALERAGISLKDKNVLILGTGGTSETAKAVAESEGAKSVKKVGRTSEINYENCYELKDTEVVINTTPVGTYPETDEKPIELKKFPRLKGAFDCVYNPRETLLLKEAKSLGVKCSGGTVMLIAQALKAEEIWTGKTADNRLIEELLEKFI